MVKSALDPHPSTLYPKMSWACRRGELRVLGRHGSHPALRPAAGSGPGEQLYMF